ncbi:glycosyltransferase family 8 protein [Piromyces sp. E2]|nr:glycosyltransferase family 8 protein [Piromyces sp. E2]|eukprot:OUM68353.1 glycosyltransferase family 8 protein [Piromyces sp. E2]
MNPTNDYEYDEVAPSQLDDINDESVIDTNDGSDLDDLEEIIDIETDDMEESLLDDVPVQKRDNRSTKSKIFKLIIKIFILIGVIALICGGIYYYRKKKLEKQNEDENDILRKYVKVETSFDENDVYTNWNSTTGNKNAFLVMLTSPGEEVDNYYMYTSAIVYRLLHNEEVRIKRKDVDVIVMVTEEVADWKLRGLHRLGAIIKRVNKIVLDSNVGVNPRWINCYTKLRMYEMTEYETIIYLDADLFIKKNIEELFDIAKEEREKSGRQDFFGAVTDGSIKINFDHKERKGMLNAGLMVLTPELAAYKDLIELTPKRDLYDKRFMEQGLLSYYYADDNNKFNRTRYHLDPRYNAQWLSNSSMEFYDKVYVIHQKLGHYESAASKNTKVQQDIVNSIVEWINYDHGKKVEIKW